MKIFCGLRMVSFQSSAPLKFVAISRLLGM
jgi:hypothetical protein